MRAELRLAHMVVEDPHEALNRAEAIIARHAASTKRRMPEALTLPLHWRKPRRIFVNSMSDLFHEGVPEAFIAAVFTVMASCPQHTFQVLTKRPARMRDVVSRLQWHVGMAMPSWAPKQILTTLASTSATDWVRLEDWGPPVKRAGAPPWSVPPNVWLGVSVEDQAAADERIPHLLATPAAVRFISAEPLLGPVDLRPTIDAWAGQVARAAVEGRPIRPLPPRLDWVIVGGESGPGARPCDVAWVRDLVNQCRRAGLATFTKQLGSHIVASGAAQYGWPIDTAPGLSSDTVCRPTRIRVQNRAGRDPAEWPADLRVQQFPEVRHA